MRRPFVCNAHAHAHLTAPSSSPPPTGAAHHQVSANVAKAVAQKAYEGGFATALPKPHNLYEAARQWMYAPQYRRYR